MGMRITRIEQILTDYFSSKEKNSVETSLICVIRVPIMSKPFYDNSKQHKY